MTEMEKIFENAPVGSAYVALCGRFLRCNKSFCKLLGYRESELKQLNFKTITHQEDLDLSLVNVEKLLRDKINSYSIEKRYIHKDKRIKWVLVSVCLIKDDEGRPDCFFTQMQDISDKKQVEQELRESQSRYDRAIDGAGVGLWDWEIEEDKLYSSPTLLSMLGLKKHDQIPTRKDSEQYIHPDDIELRRAAMDNHLKNNTPFDLEYRLRHKSGKYIWVNSRGRAVRDELGRPIKMSGSLIDITEKKRAEQELQQNKERLDRAVRGSNVGLWDWDIKSDKIYWSSRIGEILGIKESEFVPYLGMIEERVHPSDRKMRKKMFEDHLQHGKKFDFEYRMRHKNGHYIWLHTRGEAVRDKSGKPIMIAGSVDDITERKQAEVKIDEYTKELERINADLDSFAYIASHDLKEPIRGLCNNAQFLKDDYENVLDESGLRRIDRILFLCSRMQRLVNDLLHFARLKNQDMIIKKVDLNYVIKDIKSTLQNIFDSTNAKIIVPKKLPQVTCDETIVTELYRNLITNGIKYNTKKEKIIEIGYREEIINKKTYVPQYVFYVKDNGIGIEKKHFEDIFRIFKRLEDEEEPWKGTGVGLTFVQKIVERHGGKIWLDSELKKGTTFYFTLS